MTRLLLKSAYRGRTTVALGLAFLFALLTALPLRAQTETLEARLITSTDRLTVGDPMELAVEVIHPVGYQVFVPELPAQWGDFDVRNRGTQSTTDNGDGTVTTRQSVEIALFAPGDYQTPALEVKVSDPQGTVSSVTAAPVFVTVESVLLDGDETLRDIKPQASLPIPALWPFIAGGTLLGLALLAGGIWVFARQSRRRPVIDTRSPKQIALDELVQIGASPWVSEGEYKAYYGAVTDCLRSYIQLQYGIATADRTTAELQRLIRNTHMADEHAAAFGRLFSEADLVKFAEFSPTADAAAQMLEQARSLVLHTAADAATRQEAPQADVDLTEVRV